MFAPSVVGPFDMEDPKHLPPTSEDSEGVRTLVDAMSSRSLTVSLLVALVAIVAAGSQVPQGLALSELLRTTSFSWAKLAHGLGLANVLTSWLLFFVLLLLLLNITAMLVRRRDVPAVVGSPLSGSRTRCKTVVLSGVSNEELRRRVALALGNTTARVRGGDIKVARGAVVEGILLLCLGTTALLLGWFVERERVSNGRIEVPVVPASSLAPSGDTRVLIHTDVGWVAGGPEIRGACANAGRIDPFESFDCVFEGPFGTARGHISAGRSLQAADLLIGLQTQSRSARSGKGYMHLTARQTGETAMQPVATGQAFDIGSMVTQRLEPGTTAEPNSGASSHVAVHAGADGLLFTVDMGADHFPRILSAAATERDIDEYPADSVNPSHPLAFRAFGDVTVVLWYTTVRHLWLFLLGSLVVFLGVVALVWVPHVVVVARPASDSVLFTDGSPAHPTARDLGYIVTIGSNNSAALCERVARALSETTSVPGQE